MQKIHNINIKSNKNKKSRKQTNDKTKVVAGAYLSLRKGRSYNTYHELLSEKLIVDRLRFHKLLIVLPQAVPIFVMSHLVGLLNISKIVLRTRLIRVQLQYPVK